MASKHFDSKGISAVTWSVVNRTKQQKQHYKCRHTGCGLSCAKSPGLTTPPWRSYNWSDEVDGVRREISYPLLGGWSGWSFLHHFKFGKVCSEEGFGCLVCLFKRDSFCHLGLIPKCALAAAPPSLQGESPHGIFLETKELLGEMSDSFGSPF